MTFLLFLALIIVATVAGMQISALDKRVRALTERVEQLAWLLANARPGGQAKAETAMPTWPEATPASGAKDSGATDSGASEAAPWDVDVLVTAARVTAVTTATGEPAPVPAAVAELAPTARMSWPEADPPTDDQTDPDPDARPGAFGLDFEDLFGRRLAIWAGGGILALAGFFIVKYAIDLGLVSPHVRVTLGLLFGLTLIAGAELALRFADRVRDPRVAQALSGAGIATLYACILMAHQLYGLIPALPAFVGMALVTGGALFAARRFGPPSALLGLIGGFATPVLVGDADGNTTLLTLYLCLLVAGLTAVSRKEQWPWLTLGTLIGGFGWGLVLILAGMLDTSASVAFALLLLILGVATPLFSAPLPGQKGPVLQAAGAIAAALQATALVVTGGFSLLHWSIYGLIGAALVWLAWRDRSLRRLPAVALLAGLISLLLWLDADAGRMIGVLTGMAVIFGVPAALALWRPGGGLLQAGQLVALLGLGWLAISIHSLADLPIVGGTGWLAFLFGLIAAGLAALGWRCPDRLQDGRFALMVTTAAGLLALSALSLLGPYWPAWFALITVGLMAVLALSGDRRLSPAIIVGVVLTSLNLILPPLDPSTFFDQWGTGRGTLGNALTSLMVQPVLVGQVAPLSKVFQWLGLPAALLLASLAAWHARLPRPLVRFVASAGAIMAVATVYTLIKHGFGIDSQHAFVARGFLERLVIDQLLFATGALLLWRGQRIAGWVFTGAATVRVLLFGLVLFNPAWTSQAVGAAPVFNLLTPTFLLPLVWLGLLARSEATGSARGRGLAVIQIVLLVAFAMLSVRQVFQGSLMAVGTITEPESIAYSLAAIVTALAMLGWGMHRHDRIWRVASLVLMLLAIGKAFVFDTAGLEGLLRIASFVVLGFSLIGIGWLYSRVLQKDKGSATAE